MIRLPRRRTGVCCALLPWLALHCAPLQARELVVSVAISLRPAVEEIAALYRLDVPDVEVALGAGASVVLLQQILHGAPVDVFVSAAPDELDRLEREGLLAPATRRDVASNRLVVLSPPSVPVPQSLDELAREGFGPIAVGNPATSPLGRYTRQALVALQLAAKLDERLVLGEDARQVVAWVQRGEVAAGIGYRSDAILFADRVGRGPELPAQAHAPILYQAAVLSASAEPEAARRFLALLLSPRGREVLERRGFLAPP